MSDEDKGKKDSDVQYDDEGNKLTETRDNPPKGFDKAEIEGPTPQGKASTGREAPPLPTDVKEVRPVPDDQKEEGSGPVVEQVLEDHVPQAPRETQE